MSADNMVQSALEFLAADMAYLRLIHDAVRRDGRGDISISVEQMREIWDAKQRKIALEEQMFATWENDGAGAG